MMENQNILNAQKMAADIVGQTDAKGIIERKEPKREYDPILDDPISEGSEDDKKKADEQEGEEESSSEGDASDEGIDIEFPRDDADELLAHLHRELTNLSNLEDGQKRKFALLRLYEVFVLANKKADKKVYQEILPQIQKPLFKRFSDKIEKNRELATLIVREFFARCDDLTMALPYLLPVLRDRLNAEDLEGIDYLPDFMKPSAEQKAMVMKDQPEDSEEVRANIAEIVTIILKGTAWDCIRAYTQDLSNLCRALCMDSAGNVIIEGTMAMRALAVSGGTMLIHFCEVMGRALFTAMVHKHAKVRCAGLNALFDVMCCGQWKTSVEILHHMVGFRDPNIVPIKDFYEPTHKINYMALFVSDRSSVTRKCFYKTIGDLLVRLPDKVDHEGRLFPYLLSGLFDSNEEVQLTVFEILEEIGSGYEVEYEEKLRDYKQLGVAPEWSFENHNPVLDYPYPIIHRPCMGARWMVRQYVRRYVQALSKEVSDWQEASRLRSANLLLYSVIYTEEFIVQYIDNLFVALYKSVLEKEDKALKEKIPQILRFLGCYCTPKHYQPLLMSAIKNELASCYSWTQSGAIRSFGHLFTGSLTLVKTEADVEKTVSNLMSDFLFTIENEVVIGLDLELAELLVLTFLDVVDCLQSKQDKGIEIRDFTQRYSQQIFNISIKCLAVFQSFRVQRKPDPDNISEIKQQTFGLLQKLEKLQPDDVEGDLYQVYLPTFVQGEFENITEDKCSGWALQNPRFRLIFALICDITQTKHLRLKAGEFTLLEEYSRVLKGIMINQETNQNTKAKHLSVYTLFPTLVKKAVNDDQHPLNSFESELFMGILEQATKVEWGSKYDNESHLMPLLQQHLGLINSGGVVLGEIESTEQFQSLIQSLLAPMKAKTVESLRKEAPKVLRMYLQLFKCQVLDMIKDKKVRAEKLCLTRFLPALTDMMLVLAGDYFDSVRDETCQTLLYIALNYLNFENNFSTEQMEGLQVLRANVQQGWSAEMAKPCKEFAEMECTVAEYIFTDAQQFLNKIITVMMDEVSTREVLGKFVMCINNSMPFLLMNDFRISQANNSLQRVQVLKTFLSHEASQLGSDPNDYDKF